MSWRDREVIDISHSQNILFFCIFRSHQSNASYDLVSVSAVEMNRTAKMNEYYETHKKLVTKFEYFFWGWNPNAREIFKKFLFNPELWRR